MTFELINFGWPLVGLGAAVVLLILLFATDIFRSNGGSRWKDLVWLAWLAVPMYLLHQFEEYTMNITDGKYDIIEVFFSDAGPFATFQGSMELPMAHFPLMNIVFVWIAIPITAWICRKNPVIGLSGYGFVIANGFVHIVGAAALGMGFANNPGAITGLIFFIPLTIWVIYAAKKSGVMKTKHIVISMVSGSIGHIALASCYLFAILGLPAGTIVADFVVSFTPIIVSCLLCRIFRIDFYIEDKNIIEQHEYSKMSI